MTFACTCGSAFLLSGHLYVIIDVLSESPEKVIIVYLTSQKAYSDNTVVLSPNDHDFIKHPTVISYADARIVHSDSIIKRIAERDFEPRESFSDETVKIIQQGLIDSPFTPRDIKGAFLANR